MSLSRFVSLTALMTLAGTSAAMAGFQFSAPPVRAPQPQAQQHQEQQQYYAPSFQGEMPVAPAAPVEQIELSPMPMIPAEQALGLQPAPRAPQQQDGRLVINPYPLQQQGVPANHESAGIALDRAMMEQSGQLQTINAPGSRSGSGAVARAAVTSRFDGNAGSQGFAQPDYSAPSSVTPLPGEYTTAALPPVQQQPVMSAPAIPVPRAPEAGYQNAGGFSDAVGFGRDLPLALAMTQVVPPEYTFSFASDVDAGANVSWKGGKAWNAVLNDMLAQQGLTAAIAGRQVTVQRLR
jgi:hypothetical protein